MVAKSERVLGGLFIFGRLLVYLWVIWHSASRFRQHSDKNGKKPRNTVEKIRYTGTNYEEVKNLCGDRILSPYFCMGFSMLSLLTEEGFVTVNEGDMVVKDDDGTFRVEQ